MWSSGEGCSRRRDLTHPRSPVKGGERRPGVEPRGKVHSGGTGPTTSTSTICEMNCAVLVDMFNMFSFYVVESLRRRRDGLTGFAMKGCCWLRTLLRFFSFLKTYICWAVSFSLTELGCRCLLWRRKESFHRLQKVGNTKYKL